MEEPRDKIERILESLLGQVTQGLLFFYCSRSLHAAFAREGIIKRSYLFYGAYLASTNEAILAVARTAIADSDSITIHYLLNYAENMPHLFSSDDHEIVRQSVKEQKGRLEGFAPLIDSIREQRDRVLAHLDRKHVNDPSALFAHPEGVDMTGVGRYLIAILDVVNFYAGFFNTEFDPRHLEAAIAGDIDILVRWMSQYGKPEEWIRPPIF